MDIRILSIIVVICIFFVSVITFSLIYYSYGKSNPDPLLNTYMYSLYTSITIQTSIGLSDPVGVQEYNSLKIWVIIQSIITYMISIGLVFILLKHFYKHDTITPMKNDLDSIKKMVSRMNSKKK
jgi:hypothetical protein